MAAYVGRKLRQASSARRYAKSWLPKSMTLDTSTSPFSAIACTRVSRSATATARVVPYDSPITYFGDIHRSSRVHQSRISSVTCSTSLPNPW